MNAEHIHIHYNYSIFSNNTKLALVDKEKFFKAMNFIKTEISEDAFYQLLEQYIIIIPNAKVFNNGNLVKNYIIINSINFNYFVIAVKILMEHNYQILKDKYQFEIIPLNIEENNF